jgi:gag-polyprotein putative aspartyl protease
MTIATLTTRFGGTVLAGIAVVGLMTSRASADDPEPARTLREKGLVRSGTNYILKDVDGLKDRIADLDRRSEEWKREQNGLDQQLETLGRLRVEHEEIMKKLRALVGRRPDTKDFGPRHFPDDGPRGPGSGPPPLPPDEMGGFGPGSMDDMIRQLGINDSRRQYGALNAERAGLAVEIVSMQVASEDLARKLEVQRLTIEARRLEAIALDKEIRARHHRLTGDTAVRGALATLNETSNPKVSLWRPNDYASRLAELGDALALSRQAMLKQLAQVELKGMNRLTGLVGVAETLLQEMGASAGRIQALEREAASRRRLLARDREQLESLGETLRLATDSSRKNELSAQLRAKQSSAEKLRAESKEIRESLGELNQNVASGREEYLRIAKALKDAIDEADKEREPAPGTGNARARGSADERSRGERKSVPIDSIEAFKTRLREFEKAIHSDSVVIDTDKTVHWIEVSLNGKSHEPMMIDTGIPEIRLSARLASAAGVLDDPGEPAAQITTIDGRTIPARWGRLETIAVGPITFHDVRCLVLSDKAGDVPSILGGEFLNRFSTRIDADAGIIVLTQVQVKPIHQAGKAATTKATGSPRIRKTAPAAGRSTGN